MESPVDKDFARDLVQIINGPIVFNFLTFRSGTIFRDESCVSDGRNGDDGGGGDGDGGGGGDDFPGPSELVSMETIPKPIRGAFVRTFTLVVARLQPSLLSPSRRPSSL